MLTNKDLNALKEFCEKSHLPILKELAIEAFDELLTLREAVAPKMAEVDAIVHRIVSYPHDDNYIPAMRLASMLRFSILYAKREYHRAEHKNDQLESQLALVSTLTVERDVAREEVADLQNQKTEMIQVIINHRDSIVNQSQKIDSLTAELAALRSAPQMAEVNALWAMWLKTRPPDDEPVVEDLVDLARQTILAYEREKRRADEAEKEARRVECCTCGHEMVEVDGQFGCEHCDHEYDQTCECPNCHQTRERESAQSRIATLTSERDELESMRKEDIKAVLCLQSEIERLLAKVEHKKQQLEIDAVNQAAEWAKESERLNAENKHLLTLNEELRDLLTSARAIAERKGVDTAWKRFSQRLAYEGIGSVTAKVFKVLPSDLEVNNADE